MRAAAVLRSGGRPFFYPKTVWSPAGGWHADPANWRGAAATAAAAIAAGQTQLRGGRREGVKQPRVCACVVAPRVACSAACRGDNASVWLIFMSRQRHVPTPSSFYVNYYPPSPAGAFCVSMVSSANEVRSCGVRPRPTRRASRARARNVFPLFSLPFPL